MSAPAPGTSKYSIYACGFVAAAVPFLIGISYILNHFYVDGAYFQDSGQLAYLLSHPDPLMRSPRVFDEASFWRYHVSLTIRFLSEIYPLTPFTPPQYYALYIGTGQALLAIGVFWALVGPLGLRGKGGAIAAVLAIVFANSGLAIAVLRFPHYEILISASLILLLVSLHQGRYAAAFVWTALALCTREDGGFHVATFLAATFLARRILRLPAAKGQDRIVIWLFVLSMLYSVGAVLWQYLFLQNDLASFRSAYAGHGAFPKPGVSEILSRLAGWLMVRSYISLPLIVVSAWAVMRRNYYLLAGYAATVPWLALQVVAIAALPRTLSSYYAFPLIAAMFWPLLGVLQSAPRADRQQRREAVIGFALMLAVSFTGLQMQHNPNQVSFLRTFAPPPGLGYQRKVDDALALLTQIDPKRTTVDQGVLSLLPDAFSADQTFLAPAQHGTGTVIYFEHGFEAGKAIARARGAGLPHHYRVTGTPILIASDRDLGKLASLRQVIELVAR